MPFRPEQVGTIVKPWEDIIHLPTVEETVRLLYRLVDPVVLDFGFKNTAYEAYIPEDCRGASDDIPEAEDIREIRAQGGVKVAAEELGDVPNTQKPDDLNYGTPIEDDGSNDADIPDVDGELQPEAFKRNFQKLREHTM